MARHFESLRKWAPLLWYLGLGIVVLGPLLGSGYLLLLDAPAGPDPQWPSFFALPSEGISPAVPGLTVERLLGFLGPELPNKLLILIVIVVGGLGVHRFLTKVVGTRNGSALVGGTLFVINPWVYDRMVSGQLLLTIAYALLPWLLPALTNVVNRSDTFDVAKGLGLCAVVAAVDIHVGGMSLLLLLVAIAFGTRPVGTKLIAAAVCVVVLVAINSFWLLPSFFLQETARLGGGDLIAYAPRPRSSRILPFVLMLHGFWRLEFDRAIDLYPVRFFASFLPLIAAALYGLTRGISSRKWTRPATALATTCVVALVLGMGRSFPPTAPIADWLFNNFPGYGIYREPQKWIAMLALGYSILIGVGVDGIADRIDRARRGLGHLVALGVALPLIAGSVMLWGFGGRVHLSTFPNGWGQAENMTKNEDGSLLFLPWNHYQPLFFADFRIVANPAPEFFSSPVLISDDAQLFVRQDTPPPDPRDLYISKLLRKRGALEEFGHLVAPVGVHYVALAHVADFGSYGFLDRQTDLERVLDTDDITLYENLAFAGTSYGLEEGRSSENSLDEMLSSPVLQQTAGSRLLELGTTATTRPLPGPSFIEGVPGWDRVDAVDTPVVGTDRSCLDGWRLGSEEPVCHLGALAAFRSPGTDVPLWRPGIALQILAYLISASAVGALILVILKVRGTDEKTPRTEWGSSPTSDGR